MEENFQFQNSAELISKINRHLEESKALSLIPLIAIIGPTASGKTGLGVALAQHFQGEIISADSRQIYLHMNIGTAKPTTEERAAAPHHLIDFVDPAQPFSLSDYQHLAAATIREIHSHHKLPILVGGTGLYINSLTQNYSLPESKPDLNLRAELEKLAAEEGKQAVHKILESIDPTAASKINFNNLRYVIRAIEIARQTNQPKSDQKNPSIYHTLNLTIDWPREDLYARINQRIDEQINAGLIEETSQLLQKYPATLPSMSSLGYLEISEYLEGHLTLDQALEQFKQHTRNYAKRQLTWFRKIKPLYSISGGQLTQIITEIHD